MNRTVNRAVNRAVNRVVNRAVNMVANKAVNGARDRALKVYVQKAYPDSKYRLTNVCAYTYSYS